MQKNFDQYNNIVGLVFDLDLLVAELAARVELVEGNSQLVELKYLKVYSKIFQLSYPAIQISGLNFHAQLEMNVIFGIVIIVHFQTNNNCYHVCYRERIFVIKNFQVICQIN